MSKEERLLKIVEQVAGTGKVDMRSLSLLLDVSVDTVRRNIKELDDQGLLKAIRGGAIAHSPIPLPHRERLAYDTKEKEQIALKAITLLQDGQVVLLDAGTSNLAMAQNIPEDLKITVITNSFPIANVLENHEHIELIFAGGRLSKMGFHTTGFETIKMYESIRADICFMSVFSIHPEMGITSNNYEDAELKKTMIRYSKKVVALATSSKTNTAEAFFICSVSELFMLITDASPEDNANQAFKNLGVRVL